MMKKKGLLILLLILSPLLLGALLFDPFNPYIARAGGNTPNSVYQMPPVNTTIVVSDDVNFAAMMKNPLAPYTAYFKTDSYTSKSGRYMRNSYVFEFDIGNSQAQWYNSITRAVMGNIANPQHTVASTSETVLTYANAWSGTDLVYSTNETCLKEQLTIRSIPTNVSAADFFRYRINVYYNNTLGIYINSQYYLHPSSVTINTTGSVEFWDSTNTTVFSIPAPFIYDSAGHQANATFFFSLNNGIDLWYLGIPKTFLDSATYPVYLDPSIVSSTDSANAVYNPYERKPWGTPAKQWTAWASTTDWLYSSSSDGTSWSTPSTLRDENNTNPSDGIQTKYFTSTSRTINTVAASWMSNDQGSTNTNVTTSESVTLSQYVNAFDSSHTQWNTTGASPYLQNGDSEYISTLHAGVVTEGHFNFSAFLAKGVITTISLTVRAKSTVGGDSLQFNLYNGTAWSGNKVLNGITTTGFSNCFAYVLTGYYSSSGWAQLNLTQIELVSYDYGTGDTFSVSAAVITVAYYATEVDFGIKAYQVNYAGTAYDLGTASTYYDIVTVNNAFTGYQSNNSWSPTVPTTPQWNYTDAVKIEVYVRTPAGNASEGAGPWSLRTTWMTSPLDTSAFVSSAWNTTYYLAMNSTYSTFCYGSSTFNSKIENFKITYLAYNGVGKHLL